MKVNDFVINKKVIGGIQKNSVGLVKKLSTKEATVFFIGKRKTIKLNIKDISFLDLKKTGKPYDVKICNICHVVKKGNEFDINQTDALGRKTTRPSCKECRVDIDGVKIKRVESLRMEKIKPELLFVCPICQKMSIVGITAKLVKDHDHKTGMAREWICDSCNTGLGRFKDDIKLLQNVILYIKKHSGK